LRVPFKPGGRGHRGFGFVEYLTADEALSAKQALSNSHFYGRHLIIEFSKDDESLEAIRKKSQKQLDVINRLNK